VTEAFVITDCTRRFAIIATPQDSRGDNPRNTGASQRERDRSFRHNRLHPNIRNNRYSATSRGDNPRNSGGGSVGATGAFVITASTRIFAIVVTQRPVAGTIPETLGGRSVSATGAFFITASTRIFAIVVTQRTVAGTIPETLGVAARARPELSS
jgi:hypothetical protein